MVEEVTRSPWRGLTLSDVGSFDLVKVQDTLTLGDPPRQRYNRPTQVTIYCRIFYPLKDLGECKTMGTPPKGVDDVFAATMVLLAGTSPSVVTTKAGKVKDRSWDASKKQLLGEN